MQEILNHVVKTAKKLCRNDLYENADDTRSLLAVARDVVHALLDQHNVEQSSSLSNDLIDAFMNAYLDECAVIIKEKTNA